MRHCCTFNPVLGLEWHGFRKGCFQKKNIDAINIQFTINAYDRNTPLTFIVKF